MIIQNAFEIFYQIKIRGNPRKKITTETKKISAVVNTHERGGEINEEIGKEKKVKSNPKPFLTPKSNSPIHHNPIKQNKATKQQSKC